MTKITLSKIEHRGETRIKVLFEKNAELIAKVKSIKGRKWSATKHCWHVPYSKEALAALKKKFDEIILPEPEVEQTDTALPEIREIDYSESIVVEMENDWRIKAFVPWGKKEWIKKIKTITGRAWNEKEKYWSLPLTKFVVGKMNGWFAGSVHWRFTLPKNLPENYTPKNWKKNKAESTDNQKFTPLKKTHGGDQSEKPVFPPPSANRSVNPLAGSFEPAYLTFQKEWGEQKMVTGNQIIVEQWDENWLCAYVPGDKKGWLQGIKSIRGSKWRVEHVCWLLPFTKETLQELDKFGEKTLVRNFAPNEQIPEKFPATGGYFNKQPLNDMQRLAISALEERLYLEFKSPVTIRSYGNILKGLMFHYPTVKPSSITLQQLNKYIVYKRKQNRISSSYLNQIINAFNAFFGRVLGQEEKVLQLERPKRDRKVPNFISAEEMKKLLNASENTKHKCMLILIYSAGLRKSELLNLRLRDLNASAQCIFVKGGKGRKDRLTLYSPTAIKYVNEYLREYHVSYWLFEGQTGGRYSASGLQKIFERAKQKAGVNERLTIHGLRHSFATHLTYKGVPLHETKRLLGHESIKTTEVYLHLANRYKSEIQSPLEDLDM